MTIYSFLVAFGGTLVGELAVAHVFSYRSFRERISIICVNLITHPLLWYVLWINITLRYIPLSIGIILVLELIVVVIESLLVWYAWRCQYSKCFILAFCMNATSFVAGIILSVLDLLPVH